MYRNYSKGQTLTADSYQLCLANSRQELCMATTIMLRHIMSTLNIPLKTLNTLWVLFYVLIVRRVLPRHQFSDMVTIWSKIMQLNEYDKMKSSFRFSLEIKKNSIYGFRRYFGITSDDSIHHKSSMHVLICSHVQDGQPSFRHLSCTPSPGKDAEGNARKNVDVLAQEFDDEVLSHIVGGTTDNASSVLQENQFVFDKIQERLLISPIPANVALTHVNGVYKRCIKLGDLFHIDNLIVSHCSVAATGDTENAQHSQIHHRQLLMSMHSLNSNDSDYAKMAMREVMAGTNEVVSLKTTRERAQRWLVNQKYASWVVQTQKKMTSSGVPCLTAWGLYYHNNSRIDWV